MIQCFALKSLTAPSTPSLTAGSTNFTYEIQVDSVTDSSFDTFDLHIYGPDGSNITGKVVGDLPLNFTTLSSGTEYSVGVEVFIGSVTSCGITESDDLDALSSSLTVCTR